MQRDPHDGPQDDKLAEDAAHDRRRIAQLEDEIAELSATIDAATARLLVAIAEFDRRQGWNDGFVSCADWLSYRVGINLITAREKVRVARAHTDLPRITAALARGRISYSKVREVTRVATPENEEELVELCQAGTAAQVQRIVRAYRRCERAELDTAARQRCGDAGQVRERPGHADLLPGGDQVDTHAVAEPVGAGDEAVVPALALIELGDGHEQARRRRVDGR
jgi:hypothetical protein